MAKRCDFTLHKLRSNLPLAFSQVIPETSLKLIVKIIIEENKYWDEDGKIDENQGVDINQSIKNPPLDLRKRAHPVGLQHPDSSKFSHLEKRRLRLNDAPSEIILTSKTYRINW